MIIVYHSTAEVEDLVILAGGIKSFILSVRLMPRQMSSYGKCEENYMKTQCVTTQPMGFFCFWTYRIFEKICCVVGYLCILAYHLSLTFFFVTDHSRLCLWKSCDWAFCSLIME